MTTMMRLADALDLKDFDDSVLSLVLRVLECSVVCVPRARRLDAGDRVLLPLVLRIPQCSVVRVPRTRRLDAAGGGACGRHERGREDNNDGQYPTESDAGKEHCFLPCSGFG
jgi:hypothetical protein